MLDYITYIFCIYWDDRMIFYSVIYWVTLIDYQIYDLNLTVLEDNQLDHNVVIYCWIHFASILFRIFESIFISETSPEFFLFMSGFSIRILLTS